jgi:serine/threonine protein kinase
MGGGLSRRFDPQPPSFTTDCWNVINTTNLETGERVSLWNLDGSLLTNRFPNSADQIAFVRTYSLSIQKVRKFRHPHILHIHEVFESARLLEFTTEPVECSLSGLIGQLDTIDSAYFAYQIMETLMFLHRRAKMVHFGVSPSSVLLSADLSVKLFGFAWLTQLSDDGIVHPPFREYVTTSACPSIHYSAPELVFGRQCSAQTDVFAWGAVLYEMLCGKQLIPGSTKGEYNTSEFTERLEKMKGAVRELLSDALHPAQALRVGWDRLMKNELLESKPIKALIYMDGILAKDPRDKFGFFRGLFDVMASFSERILRRKVIPLLIEECCEFPKFAPVLIGPIIEAAKGFTSEVFTDEVYLRIVELSLLAEPPQIVVAFIRRLDTILEKTDSSLHDTKVNHIVVTALQSQDPLVMSEILKKLPTIIPLLSKSAIQKAILPRLINLSESLLDLEYIVPALKAVVPCLERVDHDKFLKWIVPRFANVLHLHPEPVIIQCLSELLMDLHGSNLATFVYAVPLAAEIAAGAETDPYYEQQLLVWMLEVVNNWRTSPEVDNAEEPQGSEPEPSRMDLAGLFDALAEWLNLSPDDQVFDFTLDPADQNAADVNETNGLSN